MKTIILTLVAALLIGCAARPSLEELKDAAQVTGDWTEVERREKIIERRKARKAPTCPDNLVAWCEKSVGELRCVCTTREDAQQMLDRMLRGW